LQTSYSKLAEVIVRVLERAGPVRRIVGRDARLWVMARALATSACGVAGRRG
jgi:hypothetical protein